MPPNRMEPKLIFLHLEREQNTERKSFVANAKRCPLGSPRLYLFSLCHIFSSGSARAARFEASGFRSTKLASS